MKIRDIDLVNEARRSLYAYLQKRARDESSPYVFPSQRSARLQTLVFITGFVLSNSKRLQKNTQ